MNGHSCSHSPSGSGVPGEVVEIDVDCEEVSPDEYNPQEDLPAVARISYSKSERRNQHRMLVSKSTGCTYRTLVHAQVADEIWFLVGVISLGRLITIEVDEVLTW